MVWRSTAAVVVIVIFSVAGQAFEGCTPQPFAEGSNPLSDSAESPSRAETIVVGRISKSPRDHLPRVAAMADYLAQRLEAYGIKSAKAVIAGDNREMEALLRNGDVDLVSETPMTALSFADSLGAEILLSEWKGGVATYRTVLLARKDSAIKTLSDLVGRMIAFEDEGSSSAFFVPLALLKSAGLDVVRLDSNESARAPNRVNYTFAGGEFSIAAWVHRGIADAGAISNVEWRELCGEHPPFENELFVFHRSEPVVRSVILARPGLEPGLKQAVIKLLTSMDEASEGQAVLETYSNVKHYQRFADDTEAGMEEAKRLYSWIRKEVQ